MAWRHSGSPRPKKFRVRKAAGKVLASNFWDQDGYLLIDYLPKGQTINSSLTVFPRAKLSTPSFLISAGAIEGHFEGKTQRESHQGGLVLARQYPGLPGTCNPEETGLPGLSVS